MLPVKVVVVMAVPFSHRVTPVISEGFPVPETDRIKPVKVTVEGLGLFKTSC